MKFDIMNEIGDIKTSINALLGSKGKIRKRARFPGLANYQR